VLGGIFKQCFDLSVAVAVAVSTQCLRVVLLGYFLCPSWKDLLSLWCTWNVCPELRFSVCLYLTELHLMYNFFVSSSDSQIPYT